jgi:two-component SAPR family response regulator
MSSGPARVPDMTGLRVLVVEDDFLLAMDYEQTLRGAGCEVLGPVSREEKATALLEEERPDAVILDLNLAGRRPTALAGTMVEKGIPFVIVSGYAQKAVDHAVFRNAPLLAKPVRADALFNAIATLVHRS